MEILYAYKYELPKAPDSFCLVVFRSTSEAFFHLFFLNNEKGIENEVITSFSMEKGVIFMSQAIEKLANIDTTARLFSQLAILFSKRNLSRLPVSP